MNIEIDTGYPYGDLLNQQDLQLQRQWFEEMVSLLGVKVIYRACRENKTWTRYSEIDTNYYEPQVIGCVFNEYPDQQTMKKLGWVSELDTAASIISIPFDTPKIQVGALFIIPNALNPREGRLFRVTKLSTIMICPASITCELVPEYEDTTSVTILEDHKHNSFNILKQEEDYV